jgi:hypothetical protein
MLTIIDLNRNEELSASEMGKVAGGLLAFAPVDSAPRADGDLLGLRLPADDILPGTLL